MSNLMGKLADRASIFKSAFSELDMAVIKATKHNTKLPKEKHVRRLVVFSHDEPHRIPEMIALLAKRLEFPDWLVVMKTLGTFHRLMRDGDIKVINELRYKSNIFNLRRFADTTSPEAHHQSIFVRKYSQYLEEKVLVYKILSVEFEKDAAITKSYTVDEAFERIPRLQSQMNALLNCRASKDHLNNSIIVFSFGMLLKDSFKLYKALNDGIINLLEHYFSMPKDKAVKALDIYKLFAKETDGIIQFYDISRKISKTDLPELQHAPTTLVEALENYISEVDAGRTTGMGNSEKKSMERLKREQNNMLDKFEFFEPESQVDSDSDDEGSKKKPSSATGSPKVSAKPQQPSFQPQTSKPASATADLLGDPFDMPVTSSPVPAPKSGPPMFDPFGGEDFFSSPSVNHTHSMPPTTSNQPYDPFGGPAPLQPTPMNQVAWDDKRKNIELMFGQATISPQVALSPQTSQTSFGAFGGSAPLSPSMQHQQHQQQHQQPQGFGFDPFGNTSFGAPQQHTSPQMSPHVTPFQQQNTFQPVTASNSNPFLSDNSNPFG